MLIRTAALALIATAAIAQNPGAALNGWSKLTWGMTLDQARAALPDAIPSTVVPGPNFTLIDRLTIPAVELGAGVTGRASLQSNRGADRITAVTIAIGETRDPESSRARNFGELKRLLIEKYAAPKDDQTRPTSEGTERVALWTFPRTSMTLRWIDGVLVLIYQAREIRDVL